MSSSEAFYSRLAAVAKLTNFDLDDDVADLYGRALEGLGFGPLCAALDKLGMELGPGAMFPSIKAIREAVLGRPPEVREQDDGDARTAAGLIISAIRKFGGRPTAGRRAELDAYLGPLALYVVELSGGWDQVCDSITNDNIPTWTAQFRELARAKIARARAGRDDSPPGIPAGPVAALGAPSPPATAAIAAPAGPRPPRGRP